MKLSFIDSDLYTGVFKTGLTVVCILSFDLFQMLMNVRRMLIYVAVEDAQISRDPTDVHV
jgi:hypothetical protein